MRRAGDGKAHERRVLPMVRGDLLVVCGALLTPCLFLGSCRALTRMMDFENLFSKPPNPALGKKPATDSDQR